MNIVDAIKSRRITRKLSNGLPEVKEFWSNGQIHEHYFLDKNGELHGECKWWRNDGTLSTCCHYKNGKRHGEYKYWRNDGILDDHCYYENGKRVKDYLKDD